MTVTPSSCPVSLAHSMILVVYSQWDSFAVPGENQSSRRILFICEIFSDCEDLPPLSYREECNKTRYSYTALSSSHLTPPQSDLGPV